MVAEESPLETYFIAKRRPRVLEIPVVNVFLLVQGLTVIGCGGPSALVILHKAVFFGKDFRYIIGSLLAQSCCVGNDLRCGLSRLVSL